MFGMSTGKGRAPATGRFIATFTDSRANMGAYYNGFCARVPKTSRGNDSIWVIVDRLTKTAHFLAVKATTTLEQYAELYMNEIVKLHGIAASIVSDRDPNFTSHFWEQFQTALGTKLKFSTAFHPQTEGQSERTIQTLEDMLRACVMDFAGSWETYLALMELA